MVSCHLVTLVRGTVVGTNHCRAIGGKTSVKAWISVCPHIALFKPNMLLQRKMRLFLLTSHPVLVSTSVESEGSAESKTALHTDFCFFKLLTWKAFCLQNSNHISLISVQDSRPLRPYINCEKQSICALISMQKCHLKLQCFLKAIFTSAEPVFQSSACIFTIILFTFF